MVWADAWDDVGDFTDRRRYREAIYHVLILGEDPPEHPEDEPEGQPGDKPPSQRAPRTPRRRKTPSKAVMEANMTKARELRERAMQKRSQPNE